MKYFYYILNNIVYGVDWGVMFYIACGVFLYILLAKVFAKSPVHALLDLIRELLGSFSASSPRRIRVIINGLLTLAAILFTTIMCALVVETHIYERISFLAVGISHGN
jgi:hypothetical protein